jgi:hypothetical protein
MRLGDAIAYPKRRRDRHMTKCPMLDHCQEKVDKNTYEILCLGTWKACEKMAPFVERKKPSEWVRETHI